MLCRWEERKFAWEGRQDDVCNLLRKKYLLKFSNLQKPEPQKPKRFFRKPGDTRF